MAQPDGRGLSKAKADRTYYSNAALRLVGYKPYNHNTGTASFSDVGFIGYHTLTENVDNLAYFYSNVQLAGADGGFPTESTGSVLKVSVSTRVYDGTGRYGPIYHYRHGVKETEIGPRELIEFDLLPTGLILAGTSRLEITTRVQCTLGNNIPIGTTTNSSQRSADGEGAAVLNAAHPTGTGGSIYCPCAIGTYVPGGLRSGVLILGDSIEAGTGETTGTSPYGWAARRLESGMVGYVYAPVSGESAVDWQDYKRTAGRLRLASLAPVAITGWVVNDVSRGRTAAQIKADLLAIWAKLKSAGVSHIYQKTCVPKTDSTDGYATAANQIDLFSAGQQAVRADVNEWLRDTTGASGAVAQADGALAGVLDVASLIEVNAANVLTPGGGRWLATGQTGVNAYTIDGLHPNTQGHILFGSTITSDLLAAWKTGYPAR